MGMRNAHEVPTSAGAREDLFMPDLSLNLVGAKRYGVRHQEFHLLGVNRAAQRKHCFGNRRTGESDN
jgi:hypothetical protein